MRDPVTITAVSLLIAAGIITAYPWIGFTIAATATVWVCAAWGDKLSRKQTAEYRRLTHNADREHALALADDPAGMYGMFPPEDLAA